MSIGKIALAFFSALIVALMCHRAVAQNVMISFRPNEALPLLAVLPGLNLKAEAPMSPICKMTASDIRSLQAEISKDSLAASNYFNAAADVYNSWYRQLVPQEGRTVDFAIGFFSTINQSAQTLNLISNELDSAGQTYLNSVDVIGKIVNDCFLGDSAEQNVQAEFSKFRQDLNDNQSAIDAFVGQMQSNLSSDGSDWQQWEGQPTFIPTGTFETLQNDANCYVQAAGYIRQNGQLIAKKLGPVAEQIGALTRK